MRASQSWFHEKTPSHLPSETYFCGFDLQTIDFSPEGGRQQAIDTQQRVWRHKRISPQQHCHWAREGVGLVSFGRFVSQLSGGNWNWIEQSSFSPNEIEFKCALIEFYISHSAFFESRETRDSCYWKMMTNIDSRRRRWLQGFLIVSDVRWEKHKRWGGGEWATTKSTTKRVFRTFYSRNMEICWLMKNDGKSFSLSLFALLHNNRSWDIIVGDSLYSRSRTENDH